MEGNSPTPPLPHSPTLPLRIGVVRDSAFHFYYPENLEALQDRGAQLVEINALESPCLPEVDALYLGGGFPETHAARLASNESFRASLRQAIEAGLPVIAECGGLIYLGEGLVEGDAFYPFVGVFPVTFALGQRPQGHGYTILEADQANPFFPKGAVLRGHEFRYVRVLRSGWVNQAFRMVRGTGFDGQRDGLVYRNVLATFTHVHAGGTPEWAEAVVRCAAAWQQRGKGREGESRENFLYVSENDREAVGQAARRSGITPPQT
jgi:cobyrinic acid a,c-diamide synthase